MCVKVVIRKHVLFVIIKARKNILADILDRSHIVASFIPKTVNK